ncbi:MAG: deoxyribodipyrimidine photo-lyase [Saprospiraceae bacterium]
MTQKLILFWFRRDLRFFDNTALLKALSNNIPVQPIFIFDRNILDNLDNPVDTRVCFIHQTIQSLKEKLQENGSDLWTFYGKPEEVIGNLIKTYNIVSIYTNTDYEPYARERDTKIQRLCDVKNISFIPCKDQVLFEKSEVVKNNGEPYTVFTPYKRKWLEKFQNEGFVKSTFSFDKHQPAFFKSPVKQPLVSLESMGFGQSKIPIPPLEISQNTIVEYDQKRDYPGLDATSKLGIHFRFGTLSIREKALKAFDLNQTFLNEIIWRDFYAMILWHFPHVAQSAFKPAYDFIEWNNNVKHFEAWCQGKTGYPLVDAGMRQLVQTGYMHNRVRMVVASFLCKHLLIDWRWGEAWFARHLLDFDLASNNGGWQWAAGCGTDAAPYFRIFNPEIQLKKFDKNLSYVKKWVPEFDTPSYPQPIVDHKEAREKCLTTYKQGLHQFP